MATMRFAAKNVHFFDSCSISGPSVDSLESSARSCWRFRSITARRAAIRVSKSSLETKRSSETVREWVKTPLKRL